MSAPDVPTDPRHRADHAWVPPSCTLPTLEQPLRVAELDDLFLAEGRGLNRTSERHLRVQLRHDPEVAARAARLATLESGCCSFFAFSIDITADHLLLTIGADRAHRDVLDALADRLGRPTGRSEPHETR